MFTSNHYLTSYMYQFFQTLIYVAPSVLVAISVHEFAHAYVSYRLGDMTPKLDGRLTLNPFRHLDMWGTLCLLLFHMGWARPVRVNVRSYRNRRRDLILVSAAGPVSNFLMAFLFTLLYGLILKFGGQGVVVNYFFVLFYYAAVLNVGLGVFNLIPIPPLDGSNILEELLPQVGDLYRRIRPYSMLILLVLLGAGVLNRPLSQLNSVIVSAMQALMRFLLGIGMYGGNVI